MARILLPCGRCEVCDVMMVVRRGQSRHDQGRAKQHGHQVMFAAPADESGLGLGLSDLERIEDNRLPPGGGLSRRVQDDDAEVITYVREGAVVYDDSTGRSGRLTAGEFGRMTLFRGAIYTAANPSRTDWAHVLRIALRSRDADSQPGHQQKRFSMAERRGRLLLVASSSDHLGSLRLYEDVLIYSALLERGHHVAHDLAWGRTAWLHVVAGELSLGEFVLETGDDAAISGERPVSFTAREATEILLLDLLAPPREPREAAPLL